MGRLRSPALDLPPSPALTLPPQVVPRIPLLDEDVARLQKALLEARREAETLSVALENPGNSSRWRLLEGKIPGRVWGEGAEGGGDAERGP